MTTNKKTIRRRDMILGIVLLLLIAIVMILSLTLLNEDWLKAQVEKYVSQKYQADINIESLEFAPWKGHAQLSGITITRAEENRKVDASINKIEMAFQVLPLIFHNITINRMIISEPDITIEVQSKSKPITEAPLESTLKRLEKAISFGLESLVESTLEASDEILNVFVGNMDNAIIIRHLVINKGHVNYTAKKVEEEPFALNLKSLEYSAENINAKELYDFIFNADISSTIIIGESHAEFTQHFSQKPVTLSITGINLGYLDKYLKQNDILQISSGQMDANFLFNNKTALAKITLQDLQLSQNNNATQKDFLFIPAEKLINHVNKSSGNLNLEFEIEKSRIHTSQDLEFCVIEVWEGMWKAMLKNVSTEKVKQFKEKSTQKIKDFLSR